MKTMIINSLFQKLSQQQLYLTDWKLWRVCVKGLHGWVIKHLEISLAESPAMSYKACGAQQHQQVSLGTCLNKTGHNNNFFGISPCWQ